MRWFRFRNDLGLQLLALSFFFVGLVVAGTLLFENLAGQRLEADVKAADLALARAIAQETNITMENAVETVRQLGTLPAVVASDPAGMEQVFRNLMSVRTDVNLVYRLDETGTMRFHYPLGPGSTVGTDFSFRDYFQRAQTTQSPLVSKGRISPTTNQPVATAVMPLWSAEGVFRGVIATNLKLQTLSRTLSSIIHEYRPEERLQIFIVDRAGQIIAHPSPALLLEDATVTMPDVTGAVLAPQAGSLVAADAEGEETLYSYVPIYSVGWGVVVARPTAVAFATPSIIQRGAMFAIAVFLIGGTIFWLGLSRYLIRPLEWLAAFSQSIGEDERVSAEQRQTLMTIARRPDQIGYLTQSLTRMQESIDARLNELSTLLQTSAAVVSTLDSQAVLDRILEQVGRLLDAQMCAIFALDEEQNIFRVQASRGLSQWYTEHTIDPSEPDSLTMRAIRSGQAVQIDDTETNPSFTRQRSRARAAGYRSLLAVPLNTQHAPPSALLVFRPDAHHFSEREIGLLSSFANHAAMAIENATLFAHSDMRLQEQTRRLEALIQSMQDGLILENREGRVLYANRRMETFSGLATEEIRGRDVAALMEAVLAHAREQEAAAAAVDQAVRGNGMRQVEFAVERLDGTRYLRLKVFDVTDSQGMPIGRGRIVQDITQRHEIDRMKSSLISTVSHELRTPLAAIKGYASTLLAEDVEWDPDSQREFLEIISSESDELSDLVNDLLDMSRIEAGNLTVSRLECDLVELITQASQRAHPSAGARLQVDVPDHLRSIYADPQRIEAVLRNLIENAAKYGGKDAPVRIQARRNGTELIVQVMDEGPGIPLEHSEHIFESFYRVESGLTRNKAGAGLGLAICQGFVHAHGGKIWAEPTETGTCVAFSLPLDVEAVPAEVI